MLIRFLSVPVTLALLTAAYNFARFHSIFDFGYIHIPEVQEEPWYAHGLFSIHAIPWNVYTMLFQGFESIEYFPYIQPNGFGCSIFLASPFLCLLFRQGGRYKVSRMGGDRRFDARPLVSWKPGKLAVFVSLRDDSPPLDISSAHRQRAGKNNGQRDFPFRSLSCDQCYWPCGNSFGLTKSSPSGIRCLQGIHERNHMAARLENWQNAKFRVTNIFGEVSRCLRLRLRNLTEEIARLGFAPVFPAKLQKIPRMFALIYFGLAICLGDFFCRRFYQFESVAHRCAAAILSGLLISSWFTYLAGLLFTRARQPLLWANLLFAIAAIAVLSWNKRKHKVIKHAQGESHNTFVAGTIPAAA